MIKLVRLFSLLAALAWLAAAARAEVRIDITRGRVEPMPIAVTNFAAVAPAEQQVGREVASVIAADLERSGLFKPLEQAAFLQQLTSLDVQPRFPDWRALAAQALVQGAVEPQPNGQLRIAFRLWDVFGGQQMIGQAFVTQPENWRRVAHIIADAIYTAITGETGYFDTRIVYIAESGPGTKRVKRLAIMDQDGANHRYLTDGANLVLTPRFSPTAQEITYLSYFRDVPRVYLFNIDTGRQEVLGDFPGMTYAPRFSPDGNGVIFSMATGGNSDVYVMDLRTRRATRLTDHPAIDTSPSYSPAADQITFNSDRGGSQQIYTMNADGSNVQRISFGQGKYGTPVWSPRGDLIAFTRMNQGNFYIGVMKPDGSGERLLAQGFLVEAPTWSPNGRVLMYFAQAPTRADGSGGRTRLFSIDLTGYNQRELLTPQDGSDPAWSPLIP
ncbi:MAG: Tol-Pal system beta propeller repeat protein TolB [Rhodospirillaceae bacterium]|nr:Tol-Pal system beta propeller repeat protein TolB [Rhodospirillaceae bacterium]